MRPAAERHPVHAEGQRHVGLPHLARKLVRAVRRPFEWLLASLVVWLIPRLSRRRVLRLARGIGTLGYRLCGRLRRIGLANVRAAYGDRLSAREARAIVHGSFVTGAIVLCDLFWFSREPARRIRAHVRAVPGSEQLIGIAPHIVATAHFGNWEMLGKALGVFGAPLTSAAAPVKNAVVDRMLGGLREDTGQQIIPREGAIRGLLRALRAGRRIGLVLDQNVKPEQGGHWVPFFGLPVPVSNAAASLCLRTDAPIVVWFCRRTNDGDYELRGRRLDPEPGQAAGEQAVDSLTRRVVAAIEQAIREEPGQWLWTYKTWKYIPAGCPEAERYPFYARELGGESEVGSRKSEIGS